MSPEPVELVLAGYALFKPGSAAELCTVEVAVKRTWRRGPQTIPR